MKASVCKEYGPPEKLVIEEYDDPVPGASEVLVDIKAAGINFPDVLMIGGNYQVKTPPPFILTPRVTESYPLDRYVDAFAAITERRARGKVVLTFNTDV